MISKPLRFTRYLRWQKEKNKVSIFHDLHPRPIYCDYKQWKEISASNIKEADISLIKALKNLGLIITSKENDKKELSKFIKKIKKNFRQMFTLYLILTWDCNYKCKYCPITYNPDKKNMTFEVARRGINLWIHHLKDNPNKDTEYYVIFYGGEPLLNKQTFFKTLNYINKLKAKKILNKKYLHILLATNGSLIDKNSVKLLRRNKVEVVVAIDGPQKINDYYRKDKNNRGTFKQVTQALSLLYKNKIPIYASVAVTPANIKYISKFFLFCKKYHIKKFGFNILKGKAALKIISRKHLLKYYRDAVNGIIRNYSSSKNSDLETQMKRKYDAFYKNNLPPIDCGGCGNQLVIYPNGDISNCPFLNYRLGNVKNTKMSFRIWTTPIIKKFQKRILSFYKINTKNESYFINGGGCPWNTKEIWGSIYAEDVFSNIFSKKVLEFFIWSNLNKRYGNH